MLELDYPSDTFIAQFARTHRLTPADVLRDIARLVAIHQMTVEAKFLNDNCVLCGANTRRMSCCYPCGNLLGSLSGYSKCRKEDEDGPWNRRTYRRP